MSTALLVMWMWLHGQASVADKVSLIEISSYSEINGKLWACPVGSEMASEIEGKPDGENTHWVTFCKFNKSQGETKHLQIMPNTFEEMWLAMPDDVPAVQEHQTVNCPQSNWTECSQTYWTCSDKSRVLLTSEDGAKHCIKFGVR